MFLEGYDPETRQHIERLSRQIGQAAPLELSLHLDGTRRSSDGGWVIATEADVADLVCDPEGRVTRVHDDDRMFVNSSVPAFLESVLLYENLMEAAERGEFEDSGDRVHILELERTMRARDPEAFQSPASYWPRVVKGLLDLSD